MSSIRVPIDRVGWNDVAFPINETRPITEALASIDGAYTTVYHYNPTVAEGWQLYDVTVPAWVNTLTEMHFGRGYWINVTQTLSWMLKGQSESEQALASTATMQDIPTPPATYYAALNTVNAGPFQAGEPVQALVGDVRCGASQTQQVNGQVVLGVHVDADSGGDTTGCGKPGRSVQLFVGEHLFATVPWHQAGPQEVDLGAVSRSYLPLIRR